MDAGTGFSAQVYELSHVFLHKVRFLVTYFLKSKLAAGLFGDNQSLLQG